MKFTCPVCQTTGDLPQDDLVHPVSRMICADCGTILMINPDTGEVDAHKSPFKVPSVSEASGGRLADKSSTVLSMRPNAEKVIDRTAVLVVAIILFLLIAVGIYLTFSLDIF